MGDGPTKNRPIDDWSGNSCQTYCGSVQELKLFNHNGNDPGLHTLTIGSMQFG